MIDCPVTLTPSGGVVLPGHASALAMGYTKNKGVYRLRITASGEWQGLTIRACWHLPGGGAPDHHHGRGRREGAGRARRRDRAKRRDRPTRPGRAKG